MKQLISAIPKKNIKIMDREYQIYKCVSFAIYQYDTNGFKIKVYTGCTSDGKRKQFSVCSTTINNIGTGAIDEIVDKINEVVEANYVSHFGLKLSTLEPKYDILEYSVTRGERKYNYVYIRYPLFKLSKKGLFRVNKMVGRKESITQEDINLRVAECVTHQAISDTQYNTRAMLHNKNLSELIKKQIQERDHIYFQKKQS